ncbi:MAG: hypothetical protein PF636_03240 [Actinomycetota bacterium]|jgi:hypothetical protein|nr:hypothetical protein [Actinomycetota bacterium]
MSFIRSRARAAGLAVIAFVGVVVAVLVFSLPPDVQLGTTLRLVIYHGAQTWVNMAIFTFAALAAVTYLISRNATAYKWATGFRYVAVPLWILNTALGLVSSKVAWGSINMEEPRLQATFYLLLGAGLLLAVDFGFDKPLLTALADVAMAGALWFLILGAQNFVHPDSPVMNSGWEIKGPFFGIVGGIMVMALLASWLVATHKPAEEIV